MEVVSCSRIVSKADDELLFCGMEPVCAYVGKNDGGYCDDGRIETDGDLGYALIGCAFVMFSCRLLQHPIWLSSLECDTVKEGSRESREM